MNVFYNHAFSRLAANEAARPGYLPHTVSTSLYSHPMFCKFRLFRDSLFQKYFLLHGHCEERTPCYVATCMRVEVLVFDAFGSCVMTIFHKLRKGQSHCCCQTQSWLNEAMSYSRGSRFLNLRYASKPILNNVW